MSCYTTCPFCGQDLEDCECVILYRVMDEEATEAIKKLKAEGIKASKGEYIDGKFVFSIANPCDFIGRQWLTSENTLVKFSVEKNRVIVADGMKSTELYDIAEHEEPDKYKRKLAEYRNTIKPITEYKGEYRFAEFLIKGDVDKDNIISVERWNTEACKIDPKQICRQV